MTFPFVNKNKNIKCVIVIFSIPLKKVNSVKYYTCNFDSLCLSSSHVMLKVHVHVLVESSVARTTDRSNFLHWSRRVRAIEVQLYYE